MRDLNLNEKREHGTSDFPLGYYFVNACSPRYTMEFHWHLQYEFMRIIKGNFLLNLNGKQHNLRQGDFAFINGGVIHGGKPENCIYECVVFDSNFLRNRNYRSDNFMKAVIHNKLIIEPVLNKDKINDIPKIKLAIDNFFESLKHKKEFYELQTMAYLYMFFAEIANEGLYKKESQKVNSIEAGLEPIKKSLELIQSNYSEQLSLEQLAEVAQLSSKYFCSIFQKLMHRTPIDYLNNYRVERATCLIADNKHSLIQICYDCGFNDYSYFIRVFKKYMKTTPKQYKILLHKNNIL